MLPGALRKYRDDIYPSTILLSSDDMTYTPGQSHTEGNLQFTHTPIKKFRGKYKRKTNNPEGQDPSQVTINIKHTNKTNNKNPSP